MKDLRFSDSEVQLLSELLKLNSVEIVWDINAFYFNSEKVTYKLECFDDYPDGSNFEYDEIFYCRFLKLPELQKFKEGDPAFWFKIISTDSIIQAINILEVCHKYPEGVLVDESDELDFKGLNNVSLGLIITTKEGVLPAFLLPANHGFTWLEKFGFYKDKEVEEILKHKIKKYKIRELNKPI
ncbi:hypothetical protein [Adhaeribacter soli]|uniref:Uncharacterized protein n=1 Tax=Adhaeribacter soli TaxID=2607655 RepID=A0A5N1IQK7_9BACT|nr:hypothetical protein [Adhaeribacter soli]KAA9331815.1 hypothetical protein F0P94_13525 [Adhaeribacter soli]